MTVVSGCDSHFGVTRVVGSEDPATKPAAAAEAEELGTLYHGFRFPAESHIAGYCDQLRYICSPSFATGFGAESLGRCGPLRWQPYFGIVNHINNETFDIADR